MKTLRMFQALFLVLVYQSLDLEVGVDSGECAIVAVSLHLMYFYQVNISFIL